MTQEREELMEASKSSYQLFYEEFMEAFDDEGWICKDCYQAYVRFAKENNYCVCASNTFGVKIRDFVERKKKRLDGNLVWVYMKK